MFKSPNENGQQMLARVLKCFSLYDSKIGCCQGLGFVVGPLLIDTETVFILVRFTEHYGLQASTSRSTGSRLALIISQNFAHLEAGIVLILSLFASRRGFCPSSLLLSSDI